MPPRPSPPPIAIGHLDADCFYVSAEMVRNRFLEKKPVGVLGNQGACVIAKSYEMKVAGVWRPGDGKTRNSCSKKARRTTYLRDFSRKLGGVGWTRPTGSMFASA